MTMGRRSNSIESNRREHSAHYFACQVISHNNFKSIKTFIAGDRACFALPSAFLRKAMSHAAMLAWTFGECRDNKETMQNMVSVVVRGQ